MEESVIKNPKKREEGFSLVEILLAIVILAVVCLGILALLPNGFKQITNAGRTATIDHIGQMKLDYLRSIPVTHWDLSAGSHPTTVEWPMPNRSCSSWAIRCRKSSSASPFGITR